MKKNKFNEEILEEFEKSLAQDFENGKINCPLHLSGGNEGILLGIFDTIKEDDYVISTHRSHYHYLLKGGDEGKLRNEIYGRSSGVCKGKARSMNLIDPSINFYSTAIVGGGCAIACGIALGIKKSKKSRRKSPHVWCFIGDGGEDSGHFMEAARFGIARDLPLTFIVEDNDRSTDSTKAERWHNYPRFNAPNVSHYEYERIYPHVGIGKRVSF